MSKTNKFMTALFSAALLLLSGCDNSTDTTADNTVPATREEAEKTGNWKMSPSELSSGNEADIKADLALLNPMTNAFNYRSARLLEEVRDAGNDMQKVKALLIRNVENQIDMEKEVLALVLKSSEVQEIRVLMVHNMSIAKQIYDEFNKPGFNINEPPDSFKRFNNQSFLLQQKVGIALNELNSQYGS